jgi:hypothetical protein
MEWLDAEKTVQEILEVVARGIEQFRPLADSGPKVTIS